MKIRMNRTVTLLNFFSRNNAKIIHCPKMYLPKFKSPLSLSQSRFISSQSSPKKLPPQRNKDFLWGFLLANAAIGIAASKMEDKASHDNNKGQHKKQSIITKNKPFDSLPAWLDLPKESFGELYGVQEDSKFDEIDILIDEYHNVPKMNFNQIDLRIEYLSRINTKLLNLIESEENLSLKKFFINMQKITANKMWYLAEIQQLYKNGYLQEKFLKSYHTNINTSNLKYAPMFLKNEIKYYSEFGQFWGAHYLETIDPCHRSLSNLFVRWRNQNDGKDLISFFMWLEGQNLSREVAYINQLNDEQLKNYVVTITDGHLYQGKDGKKTLVNYDSPKEEYIFNITLEREMILIPGSSSIRHTSLSKGKPVLGCGNMVVSKGKIISLGLESGHYQPTLEDGKQLLEILEDMGINLQPNTTFFYYQDGIKHKTDIAGFKLLMQKTSRLTSCS